MERLNPSLHASINNLPARVSIQDESNFTGVMNHFDVLFKIVILGDTGVGKTCILKRLTRQTFEEEHGVTIGVEFGNFGMIVKEQTYVKLQIWDTAGQESFRSITRNFYQGSDGVFLVFDITNPDSFYHLYQWIDQYNYYCEYPVKNIIIVGNKYDLEEQRRVSELEIRQFCESMECLYVRCSVLSDDGIEELISTIITKCMELEN